ncbi:MAG: hypothetical protein ACFB2Z_08235 [Maricaulaceae bacterium]
MTAVADALTQARRHWTSVKDQVAEPRARLGLIAIGVLVWAWLFLVLSQSAGTAQDRLTRARAAFDEQQLSLGAEDWGARRQATRVALIDLQRRAWYADTLGLARAEIETWLTRAAADAGMVRPRLNVRETPEPVLGQAAIVANLNGGLPAGGLIRLLEVLESNDRRAVVRGLDIRRRPALTVELEIAFPVQLGVAPPAAPAGAATPARNPAASGARSQVGLSADELRALGGVVVGSEGGAPPRSQP